MTDLAGGRPGLVVVGAGGHGREVVDTVVAAGTATGRGASDLLGVVADDADVELLGRLGVTYLGRVDQIGELVDVGTRYVIGIGSSSVRATIAGRLDAAGLLADRVIHPSATVGSDVHLAGGCYLAMGARVTTNVELGRHVHLNVNAVVSHDCTLGKFVTLSPGVLINGTCRVGPRAFFGTGAIVLPGLTIGPDAVVGAGAVVTSDVPAGATVVGVPARPMTP